MSPSDLVPHHPAIVGATIAATIAVFLFLFRDVWWQRRTSTRQASQKWEERRLTELYGPLYRAYSEAFARFDAWKADNPDSALDRRPFFEDDEVNSVRSLLEGHEALASRDLLAAWAVLSSAQTAAGRNTVRGAFVSAVVREYQGLRRSLKLGFDRRERRSGRILVNPVRDRP